MGTSGDLTHAEAHGGYLAVCRPPGDGPRLVCDTPFGGTVADGDYPTDETTGVVKKKYEHLQYDPFGARANYAGDPAERYLHDIVSFGYEGNNYDKAAGGYLAGGNLYEPQSGRLMSPAGSGENPYVYGGNSPVDRSLGISRQQMADDFTSSRFDADRSAIFAAGCMMGTIFMRQLSFWMLIFQRMRLDLKAIKPADNLARY